MGKKKDSAYGRLIAQMGWTDHDIAIFFGYGGTNPVLSMRASSRYRTGTLKDTLVRILSASPIAERISDLTAVEVKRESAKERREARTGHVMPKHFETDEPDFLTQAEVDVDNPADDDEW